MSNTENDPPTKSPDRIWLTAKQACEHLGISRTKFDELKACGTFRDTYAKHGRMIRFNREKLDQALLKRLGGK